MSATIQQQLAIALCLLSALAAAVFASQWQDSAAANRDIAALTAGRDLPNHLSVQAPLPVSLARALLLARQDRYEEALDLYNYLGERGGEAFRTLVHYNLGNLHLRRALAKAENGQLQQAVPLAELAKDAYRRSLRLDPAFWDAKYNLEVAMRLLPDFDRVDSPGEESQEEEPKGLWSGIPGFPRGLP